MEKKIIKASELPEGEKVYLKKDIFGWRAVEPVKDDSGKILWKRIILGTPRERAFLFFIIFLIGVSYLAFDEQIDNYNRVLSNPCAYCNTCQAYATEFASKSAQNRDAGLNISAIGDLITNQDG